MKTSRKSIQFIPVLLLAALLSTPQQCWGAGLTIVTHGFQTDSGIDPDHSWVEAMGDYIADRAGGTPYIYRLEYKTTGVSFINQNASLRPIEDSQNAEVVVKLYWHTEANQFNDAVSTRQVAEVIAPLLRSASIAPFVSHRLAELPIHLIGHSRGASLVAELSRILGESGIWVHQMTTLDPHPSSVLGVLVKDPDVDVYENILFADNYWQNFSKPDGRSIEGAFNRFLTTAQLQGGYGDSLIANNHSDVHLWYHGTVNTDSGAFDSLVRIDNLMRQTWYLPGEQQGKNAGFRFSRLGGASEQQSVLAFQPNGESLSFGYYNFGDFNNSPKNRVSLNRDANEWPSLVNLTHSAGGTTTAGNSFPVEYVFQSFDGPSVITLFLDADQNPYNGNEITLSSVPNRNPEAITTRGTRTVNLAATVPTTVQTGSYYLYGRITTSFANATLNRSRYLYALQRVAVSGASGGNSGGGTVSPTLPTVKSLAASAADVGSRSAIVRGQILNSGGTGIVEYRFEWGTSASPDSTWGNSTSTGTPVIQGIVDFSATLTLEPGALYYFRAAARNSVGWSYGSVESFRTAAISVGPGQPLLPPTGVVASKGTFTDRIQVSWNAAADAKSYIVWRGEANNSGSATLIATGLIGRSFDDTTAALGKTYWYWVMSFNGTVFSNFSVGDSGYRQEAGKPAPPTGVTASDGTFPDRIRITWNASVGATAYTVYRSTSNNPNSAGEIESGWRNNGYDDTYSGLVSDTTYYYWVTASSGNLTSGFSNSDGGWKQKQASNDRFENRITISGDVGQVHGSTFGATWENEVTRKEPSVNGAIPWKSVWYSWTAPANGKARFNLNWDYSNPQGANRRMLVAIYTGTTLSALQENSGSAQNGQPLVELQVTENSIYQIQVGEVFLDFPGDEFTLYWQLDRDYIPAVITQQPERQAVMAGQAASFTVKASGKPEPTYQWQRSIDGGLNWSNLTDDKSFSGTKSVTLTVNSVTAEIDGNLFRAIATNRENAMSNPALLMVNSSSAVGNVVATGLNAPNNLLVDGNDIYFTDNSASDGIIKRISKSGGTATTVITGGFTSEGGINKFAMDQTRIFAAAGGYRDLRIFSASKGGGALTTLATPVGGDFIGVIGTDIYFSKDFGPVHRLPMNGGVSSEAFRGYWVRNSAVDATSIYFQAFSREVLKYDVSKSTLSTLIATNSGEGRVFLDSASVFISVSGEVYRTPKSGGGVTKIVSSGKANAYGSDGVSVYFVQDSGIWRVPVNGGEAVQLTAIPSDQSLNSMAVDETNIFWTDTSGGAGVGRIMSMPKARTQKPVIVQHPKDQSVKQGETAIFSFTLDGTASGQYQWRRNGIDMPGETSATLRLANITPAQAGDYVVVISNSAGVVTSQPAVLTVTVPPTITAQPKSQSISVGNGVTFGVTVTGSTPLTYQWRFNGANLTGETGASLSLNNVTSAQAGDYSVFVNNSAGAIISDKAALTVTAANNPTISAIPDQKTRINTDTEVIQVTVTDPQTAAISLRVVANSDNQSLIPDTNIQIAPVNSIQPHLRQIIIRPRQNQVGIAKITVQVTSSDNRTVSISFTLTVFTSDPPRISQIADQTVAKSGVLGPISFTVEDQQTFPGFLVVEKSSSNQSLVPDANIVLGGGGKDRTVTITPAKDREGTARISLTVRDSDGESATIAFNLTVVNREIAYSFTTLAGQASEGSSDGIGGQALFRSPSGVAVDSSGNVYVTDLWNRTIRKITPEGVVNTLAGSPDAQGFNDGVGSNARFWWVTGIAVDRSGNVYVADNGLATIRKITPQGVVSTLAGSVGQAGSSDGTGSEARFNRCVALAVDKAGFVYVADQVNHTIRKITPDGVVTTLAGLAGNPGNADGIGSNARFNQPIAVATDDTGNVYVSDQNNNIIRKIAPSGQVTTLAGSPGSVESMDGIGTGAKFSRVSSIALDRLGNLYVADSFVNPSMRKISPTGVVTTLSGVPTGAVAVDDAGSLYVTTQHAIRKITPAGVQTVLAGQEWSSRSVDGLGNNARFLATDDVAVDAFGNLFVADANGTIRKITPAGLVSTFAQLPGTDPLQCGVAVDREGNVYVADSGGGAAPGNNVIWKISPTGAMRALAGLARNPGSKDGSGSDARFYYSKGVAVDAGGNVYVADSGNRTIRKITPVGVVTTLAGLAGSSGSADGEGASARFEYPRALSLDSAGNIYVADLLNSTIRKITPAGTVSTIAGLAGNAGNADGPGTQARFRNPSGVAVDMAGNVFVADTGNNTIRKIAPDGLVSTLGGVATVDIPNGIEQHWGSADGTGSSARFNHPAAIAVDNAGNLYIADTLNQNIRKGVSGSGSSGGLGFRLSKVRQLTGDIRFEFPSDLGAKYTLFYKADLTQSTWRAITTWPGTGAPIEVNWPVNTGLSGFFLIRVE